MFQRQGLRTRQACEAHPADSCQRQDNVFDPRPQNARERDGKKNSGKGEKHIDNAHNEMVSHSADPGTAGTDQSTEQHGQGHHRYGDQQGHMSARDESIQQRATKLIVTERRFEVRAMQDSRQVHPIRLQIQQRRTRGEYDPRNQHHERNSPDDHKSASRMRGSNQP